MILFLIIFSLLIIAQANVQRCGYSQKIDEHPELFLKKTNVAGQTVEYKTIYPMGPDAAPEIVWGKFRIKTIYLEKDLNLAPYESKAKLLVESVVHKLQNILSVRQVKTPIRIRRFCKKENATGFKSEIEKTTYCDESRGETCAEFAHCGDLILDEKHNDYGDGCYNSNNKNETIYTAGKGVENADFVLFYYVLNCTEEDLQAYAMRCNYENKFNAPIAGMIAFCHSSLASFNQIEGENLVLHELMHIFLDALTGEKYVDENGNPRQNTTKTVTRQWKHEDGVFEERHAVLSTLPSVVEFGKKHFNCSSFEGLELQNLTEGNVDNSFSDRFGAHYNDRLYFDALMSPKYHYGVVFTELDLAFLRDTGWYKIKINSSFPIGKMMDMTNKGCNYLTMSCYEFMESVNDDPVKSYPYCSKSRIEFDTCAPYNDYTARSCSLNDREKEAGWYDECPTYLENVVFCSFINARCNETAKISPTRYNESKSIESVELEKCVPNSDKISALFLSTTSVVLQPTVSKSESTATALFSCNKRYYVKFVILCFFIGIY